MNWILYGFKGCGKTYFGSLLNAPFIDLDHLIEEREQLPIREIVMEKGEAYFRDIEREVACTLNVENHVISLGGGTVCDPKSLQHLRSLGSLIYLKCPKATLKKRILTPPLPTFISSEAEFEKIYSQRIPLYERIADITIDFSDQQETLEALWQVINSETSLGSQPGESLTEKPLA